MEADAIVNEVKNSGLRGAGARIFDGDEVVVVPSNRQNRSMCFVMAMRATGNVQGPADF